MQPKPDLAERFKRRLENVQTKAEFPFLLLRLPVRTLSVGPNGQGKKKKVCIRMKYTHLFLFRFCFALDFEARLWFNKRQKKVKRFAFVCNSKEFDPGQCT